MSNQQKPRLIKPEHRNPSRPDRVALAPYNFVPPADPVIIFKEEDNPLIVPHKEIAPHDRYDVEKRMTGYIDVTLETKSPLYIRGTQTMAQFQESEIDQAAKEAAVEEGDETKPERVPHMKQPRNNPDFFHTGNPNQPRLPGSSLRGMVRSMVEVIGYGKLSPVSDDPLIFRAVGDTTNHGEAYRQMLLDEDPLRRHYYTPRFRGGYIRKRGNSWYIQPAVEIDGATFARINERRIPRNLDRWHGCKNAFTIYIQPGKHEFQEVRGVFLHIKYVKVQRETAQPAQGLSRAVLMRSGRMFSKRTEAVIYEPNESLPQAEWIRIPDRTQPKRGSEDPKEMERDLVAAYRDQSSPEQERLLGKSGVLRDYHPVMYVMNGDELAFFGHTQMFRLPYHHSPREMLHPAHSDEAVIDFAEAMFGRVKRKRSDKQETQAIASRISVSDGVLLPGQDKLWLDGNPLVIPRILSGPKATTFQHYVSQNNPDDNKQLNSYNASRGAATLRGHKLYWHKGNVRREVFEEDQPVDENKDTQRTKIRPIRPGIRFQFRIHFENLSLAELGLLWWAVALPVQGDYCHKLGMGKPYGLGSVKLSPTLHTVDVAARYKSLFAGSVFADGVESARTSRTYQENAIRIFEGYMCRVLRTDQPFAQQERIRMLLAMLSWPGPDLERTRYLEIERASFEPTAKRRKFNEYKDRPVLPDPLSVR